MVGVSDSIVGFQVMHRAGDPSVFCISTSREICKFNGNNNYIQSLESGRVPRAVSTD